MLLTLAIKSSVLVLTVLLMGNALAVGPLDEDLSKSVDDPYPQKDRSSSGSSDVWIDPVLETPGPLGDSPDLLLLGFQDPPPESVVDRLRLDGFEPFTFRHVPVVAVSAGADELPRLLQTPGLVSVTANKPLEWHTLPEVRASNFGGTGDEITRADRARALGYDGTNSTVAVIDTGVNGVVPHPSLLPDELGGPLVQNVKVIIGEKLPHSALPPSPVALYAEDLISSDNSDGHGTHVSSIAVGAWTEDGRFGGRAPGADLVGLATGDALAIVWAVAAFDWILEHKDEYGIQVVTNSYGITGAYNPQSALNIATRAAYDAGLTVIFSAGNNGPGLATMNAYSQAPYVIAVGASTASGAVADFSSRGDPFGSGKPSPDIVAPGADIVGGRNQAVSANEITMRTPFMDASMVPWEHIPWWRPISGTSMAAPQVAGIAAMVLQADPTLTPDEVKQILQETARPIMGFGPVAQGAGMVDAEAAVLRALDEEVPERDWVEPTVIEQDGDTYRYPFYGMALGSPERGSAFRHQHPFPVRLPAEEAIVKFSWRPLGDVNAVPEPANAAVFTLLGADGRTILQQEITGLGEGPGSIEIPLDNATLQEHARPGWTGAYWKALVHTQGGILSYTVEASVTYEDGVLPNVTFTPPPPPPPPADLTPRGPIAIPSDADFTQENGVVSGSGTLEDPYVIEGWEIEANTDRGISIGGRGATAPDGSGTTAHLVIRNVRVLNGESHCIVLDNAHNVRIEDSRFDACENGIYLQASSSGITIERNEFHHNVRALRAYGVQDTVIRDNLVVEPGKIAVAVAQGATQRSPIPVSTGILIEDNTFLGNEAEVGILTPGALQVTLRRNTFGDGASVDFGTASHSNLLSESHWLDGEPRITSNILSVENPDHFPLNTIVDAGSDRSTGDGPVCFDDARAEAGPGLVLVGILWEFGDGADTSGQVRPCHDYPAQEGPFTARLVATFEDATGEPVTLQDTVPVH